MIATTIFFIVVGIMLAIVVGINLATEIDEPELYFMFWLMYIITVATLVNIGMSIYYYLRTKDKRGPRGARGPRGDPGPNGPTGKCDPNCRNRVCTEAVLEQMAQQIRQLSADPTFQTTDIRNAYLLKTIRRICHSPQFQQLAPLKGPTALIDYIKGIWKDITARLYEEGGQRYFKSVGAEQAFDWRTGHNPWDEFKKYGVYYWGLDKSYRPDITYTTTPGAQNQRDGTVPADAFEELMSEPTDNSTSQKPRASILGFINAESTGEIINVTDGDKRGTYIMEAALAKPSRTITQTYAGKPNRKHMRIPPLTYMIHNPANPTKCLEISGQVTQWRLCDPYQEAQRFHLEWTDMAKRQFRMKAHNNRYLVGTGSKFQVVDGQTVGNEYRFYKD